MAAGVKGLVLKGDASGWLSKKKSTKGGWQERFCNLEKQKDGTFELAYYSNKYMNDSTRQGSWSITGSVVVPCTFPDGKKPKPLKTNLANAEGFIFRQAGESGFEHYFHELQNRKEKSKRKGEKKVDKTAVLEVQEKKRAAKAEAEAAKVEADLQAEEARLDAEIKALERAGAEEEAPAPAAGGKKAAPEKKKKEKVGNWKKELAKAEAAKAAAKEQAKAARAAVKAEAARIAEEIQSAIKEAREKEDEKAAAKDEALFDMAGNCSCPRWIKILESKGAALAKS